MSSHALSLKRRSYRKRSGRATSVWVRMCFFNILGFLQRFRFFTKCTFLSPASDIYILFIWFISNLKKKQWIKQLDTMSWRKYWWLKFNLKNKTRHNNIYTQSIKMLCTHTTEYSSFSKQHNIVIADSIQATLFNTRFNFKNSSSKSLV